MKLRAWGTRGCSPASGPQFVRHGGNTTCLEVIDSAGAGRLVVDAGTGVVPLGRALLADAFGRGAGELTMVLTHCHHDHILGFPFFGPIYVPGNVLHVRSVTRPPASLYDVLNGLLNANYSPLYSLKNLKATLDIADWDGGALSVGAMRVEGFESPHGAASTTALRVTEQNHTVVLMIDAEYPDDAAVARAGERARGANVLVHDAMHTPDEAEARRGKGHGSWRDAVRVAELAGASRLVLTHHDPDREDDAIDAIVADARAWATARGSRVAIDAAGDGSEFDVL